MSRRRQPEQAIQKAIFDHIAWRGVPGVFAFHPANGGWRSVIEAKIFKSLGVVAGTPDLIAISGGHCFALELKTEGGRLTDVQRVTQRRMREAGAIVSTAWGIDEAVAQLTSWQLIKGTSP